MIAPDAIVAGTATLGKLHFPSHIRRQLFNLLDNGITNFDTAPLYASGCMEGFLGEIISSRSDISVSTKFGLATAVNLPLSPSFYSIAKIFQYAARRIAKMEIKRAQVKALVSDASASLDRSRKKLKGSIKVFFAHEIPIQLLEADEFIDWITRSKSDGKFEHFGVGGYRHQYQAPLHTPIWDYIDVLQVESKPNDPPVTPPSWRGRIYLHGVLQPFSGELNSDRRIVKQILKDAFEQQNADKLVVGFSRKETLEQFIQSLSNT